MNSDSGFENEKRDAPNNFMRYNRDRRLANASEKIRQMHSSDFIKRQGIFKSLVSNKSTRGVFILVIFVVLLNLFFLIINKKNAASYFIDGTKIALSSFRYSDKFLVNIRFYKNDKYFKQAGEDAIKVKFIFIDDENTIISISEQEGIYIGAELYLSAFSDSDSVKKVQAEILFRDKFFTLTKNVKD